VLKQSPLVVCELTDGRDQPIEIDRLLKVLRRVHVARALRSIVRGRHADHRHVGVLGLGELTLAELITGNIRSSTMTAGRVARMAANASAPLLAVCTRKPSDSSSTASISRRSA
jgi:hypothetical protein